MARLVLENLSKSFPGPKGQRVRAVCEVNLAVAAGELVALVGPTGSGKTTLLRLIAGLETPDAGTIWLEGVDITRRPPGERDVAMVFQHDALFPHLTVQDNIALGLKLRKQTRTEIARAVRAAAEMLDLGECLPRRPAELSGGQRQRVALARALVRRPRAFLLDEPLAHLDAPRRAQVRAELAGLQRRLGATMLYVTHDQAEAMALGQRLAVLQAGVLQAVGAPLDLYRQPTNVFVAAFLGSPPMNFFRGRLEADGPGLRFHEQAAPGELPVCPFTLSVAPEACAPLARWKDRSVLLGLRPENFAATAALAAEPQTIAGVVDSVEHTGDRTLVRLRSAAHPFVACLDANARPLPGERLALFVQSRFAHFFDPDTQRRLA